MPCGTCEQYTHGRCTRRGCAMAPHWTCPEHEERVDWKVVARRLALMVDPWGGDNPGAEFYLEQATKAARDAKG